MKHAAIDTQASGTADTSRPSSSAKSKTIGSSWYCPYQPPISTGTNASSISNRQVIVASSDAGKARHAAARSPAGVCCCKPRAIRPCRRSIASAKNNATSIINRPNPPTSQSGRNSPGAIHARKGSCSNSARLRHHHGNHGNCEATL